MGPKGTGRMRDCQPHRTLVHGPCTGATGMPIFKHEPRRGPRDSAQGEAWLVLPGICLLCPNANHLSSVLLGSMETPATWRLEVQALRRQPSHAWPDPSVHSWEIQLSFFQAWASLLTLLGGWVAAAWNTRAAKQSPRVTWSCLSLPALPQMQTIY